MEVIWRFDTIVFRAFHQSIHAAWLDPVFWVISTTGLGWVQAIILAVFGFDWPRFPKARWDSLWPVAWAGLLTGITNNLLKQTFPRERPSNYIWADPQEGFFHKSFPSGHTAGSFAIAFAICFLTPWHWKWKLAALAWAMLVGMSRIYRGVHWPTDVIGGIGNGLFCACIATLLWQGMRRQAASAAIDAEA